MKDPDRLVTILGYRPGVIISGSMKPTLNPGDMIISEVVEPEDIKVGDVITYRVENTIPNTHRVVGLVEKDGQIMFETKGDAVDNKDGGEVSPDRLVGRMVYVIPKVGYAVEFLKTKLGFTLVIIVPIILTAVFELGNILLQTYKEKARHS